MKNKVDCLKITKGHSWVNNYNTTPCIGESYQYIREAYSNGYVVSSNVWILDYTYSYGGTYSINSKNSEKYERNNNMARLFPPHTKYFFYEKNTFSKLKVNFISFVIKDDINLNKYVRNISSHARFTDPFEILGKELSKTAEIGQDYGENGFLKAQSQLFKIVDLLFESKKKDYNEYCIDFKPNVISDIDLVGNVNKYLKDNISKTITLTELAKCFNVSLSTLSHTYKNETGISPILALNKFRIDFAKMYLSQGERMKVIADKIGFCDEYHLSKVFKKIVGVSPSKFLKKLKN